MNRCKFFMIILLIGIFEIIFCICTVPSKNNSVENVLSSSGLLKNVVKHSPRISEKEINESEIKIIKKAHEEENKMLEKVGKCAKNYALPCPKNWKKNILKNGETICTANSGYNGFCEINQSFDDFTEADKMNFESSCNVEWPCKSLSTELCESGIRDYNEPCPDGFLLQNDNSCKADISVYEGMCNTDNIIFTHMTNEEKTKWSIACEAYWPCYEDCSSNEFLSKCPKNWKVIHSFECIPTESYRGPCKGKKSFKYFTKSMKKNFEEKCKTRFVCENSCEKNYEQDCPTNWVVEKGYCLAPSSFDLCNRKKLSIENLSVIGKKEFEKECFVNWPCTKENDFCEMSWNVECPDEWVKMQLKNQEGKYICQPSLTYKGKCDNIILADNSDENTKREIASSCNAPWPCKDPKQISSHPIEHKKNNEKNSPDEVSGPITQEGNIYKKHKYIIEDQNNYNFYDIMK